MIKGLSTDESQNAFVRTTSSFVNRFRLVSLVAETASSGFFAFRFLPPFRLMAVRGSEGAPGHEIAPKYWPLDKQHEIARSHKATKLNYTEVNARSWTPYSSWLPRELMTVEIRIVDLDS